MYSVPKTLIFIVFQPFRHLSQALAQPIFLGIIPRTAAKGCEFINQCPKCRCDLCGAACILNLLWKNGKSYLTVDPERVSLGTLEIKAGEFLSGEAPVGFDAAGAAKGEYLLPIVAELPEGGAYVSKSDPMVRYIVIRVSTMDIDTEATALTGTKIEPAAGWTISCYQGTNSSGATGVWNCDTDEQKAKMFDGKLDEQCWYASSQSFSWGYGGNFIIGLDKTYDVSGFRWHYYYEDSNPQITDVRYSEDGKNWTSLSNQVAFVPKVTDQWKIFQFKEAVKARYIRVYVGNVSGFTSMNEAEIHTPAN